MAQKKVWVTWMTAEGGPHKPEPVIRQLGQYGLETAGNMWVDDLDRMAWHGLSTTLLDTSQADLWLLAADAKSLATPSNRYALSLLAATIREGRGEAFPIICLGLEGAPDPATLPTLTRTFQCLTATEQNWPARVVSLAFSPQAVGQLDCRFGIRAEPLLGQWFEVGPRDEDWAGVMFGVTEEGTITHQAVGPKGQLPERTVLEYPIEGMQAQVGDSTFTAWSVQNRVSPEDSYYVKVDGYPARLIIGGHPGTDQAEVVVIDLK